MKKTELNERFLRATRIAAENGIQSEMVRFWEDEDDEVETLEEAVYEVVEFLYSEGTKEHPLTKAMLAALDEMLVYEGFEFDDEEDFDGAIYYIKKLDKGEGK